MILAAYQLDENDYLNYYLFVFAIRKSSNLGVAQEKNEEYRGSKIFFETENFRIRNHLSRRFKLGMEIAPFQTFTFSNHEIHP